MRGPVRARPAAASGDAGLSGLVVIGRSRETKRVGDLERAQSLEIGQATPPADGENVQKLRRCRAAEHLHCSHQLELFPLETAVWKMTGLTAGNFGLEGRGRIAEGAFADLVVFDADAVLDTATYEEPQQAAAGIDAVVVNGQAVWGAGRDTGARPGQVLRRGGSRMSLA